MIAKSLRLVVALLVAPVLIVPATSGALAANERRPPRTVLRVRNDVVQRGRLGTYCWSYQQGDFVTGTCSDAVWSFPTVASVKVPARATIRIRKPERPSEWEITAWRRVGRSGGPIGRGEDVGFRLAPVRRGGAVIAWDASFRLSRARRHYYIYAFGVWEEGDADYTFHIKAQTASTN